MRDIIREDARLIILRELHKQNDYQLNDGLLRSTLDSFGIGKSREWVRDELKYLEDLGAVRGHGLQTFCVQLLQDGGGELGHLRAHEPR